MRKMLNVIVSAVFCALLCNGIVKHFDGKGKHDVSETYRDFNGMFGLKFGDVVSEGFTKYGQYEGNDVYLGRPPCPAYGFDRYAVFARPHESRILLIRAEKDFSSKDELKDFVKSLKADFADRFRTAARKMEQDDSWAFVFVGPKNGYDKGITIVSGYDASSRKWLVQLNAFDGNIVASR